MNRSHAAILAGICLALFVTFAAGGEGIRHAVAADSHDHGSARQGIEIGRHVGELNPGAAQIIGARFLDVDGHIRRLGDEAGAGGAALVFVDEECPVSSRYLGELNEFAALAEQHGVDFYAVVSSPHRNWKDARALRDRYGLRMPVLLDPSGDLARRLKPQFLAEAFVIDREDRMIYRGRIDDRFAGIGRLRRVIRHHDLKEVLKVAHDLGTRPRATPAVGCFFEQWPEVASRKVSYARDIAPLLAANCVECHQQGGVAPFALQTHEQAVRRARMLDYTTGMNLMPPWRAMARHGRFRDERYLSDLQKALLAAWQGTGRTRGDDAELPPEVRLPDPGWRGGKPDLVLTMQEPFKVPARGDDIYRYFVIPSGMTRDRTVVGLDFMPGDPRVVHHANFFVDYAGRARRMDAKDAEPGFSVFGTGGFMSYSDGDQDGWGIGGWTPGAEPYRLPGDVGLWLPKGGDIVLEIHYKLSGKATTDQSSIGIYFAKEPRKNYLDGLLIGTQDLHIPAGDFNYVRHVSMDVPVGFRLVDIMPHMHYVGSQARVTVTHPDGKVKSLIGIEDWDLRWQNIYVFREPVHIPAGSRLDAWFVYDNSNLNSDNPHHPPKPIKWGWNTNDEMAEVWMGIVPDDPSRRKELVNASNRTWYNVDSRPLP